MKLLIRLLPALFVFMSCATMPDRSSYAIPQRTTPGFEGIEFGVCHGGYIMSEEEYGLINQLSIQWLRVDFSWKRIEPVRGQWDFAYWDEYVEKAHSEGKKILAILDYDVSWIHRDGKEHRYIPPERYSDFLNYIEAVIDRYGDRLGAVEIWNEPNTSRFWKGPDREFFQLTEAALDKIEEIAPDLPVAVGSVFYFNYIGAVEYIERLADSGVLDKADALSIHPYSLNESIAEDKMIKVRSILDERGYDTPLWVTEIGYPTGGAYPHKVSLEEQPYAVAKNLTAMAASGTEMIIWYCLFDSLVPERVERGMSSEHFFGLAWPDYEPKPGALPYGILAGELAGTVFHPDMWDFSTGDYKKLYQAHFLNEEGERKIVLWSTRRDVLIDLQDLDGNLHSIVDLTTGRELFEKNMSEISVTKTPILLLLK